MTPTVHRFRARRGVAGLATVALSLAGTALALPSATGAPADGAPSAGDPSASTSARATTPKRLVPSGWPNRGNTGASGKLRTVGGRTVTKDGATLKNLEVKGTLTIRADNVTVRNVRVLADSYYGIIIYGKNTVIEHTSVIGTNLDVMAGIAVIEGNVTATRVKVKGVEDGVRLGDNSVLRDSLVYGLRGDDSSHFDGVTADGGYRGWRIIHNTILNPHRQTGAVWVGDGRYGDSEGVMRNNYVAGGGYTIYAGPGTGKGIRVIDNVFSTRYYPRSGYWGVSSRWESAGNTWSGNTWHDGRRKGARVRP